MQETMTQRMKRIREEANEANRKRAAKDAASGMPKTPSKGTLPIKTVRGEKLVPNKPKGTIQSIRNRNKILKEAAES